MRIGIDVRSLAAGKTTGVEEYTRNFLRAIFEQNRDHEFVLFFNAYKGLSVDFAWAQQYDNVTVKHFRYPNKLLNLMLWYLRYPKLDKLIGGVDYFFMPNINFAAFSQDTKLLLTIHDLSFEHYKESFSRKRRLWHWMVNPRKMAREAHRIIAVSDATKHDICESYGISQENVQRIHNGKTDITGTLSRNDIKLIDVKERYDLPYAFILYFGTIEPRKNIVGLVKAYNNLREQKKTTHKLVIAGARGWQAEEIYYEIERSQYKEDIILIHDVPAEDREALYVLADVFVYPSFFEGFGFPPLEALMCGTPVITSHTSSLPEVVGKHAILVDPYRTEEITHAMHSVLTEKSIAEKLSDEKNVAEHVRQFSWKRAAQEFLTMIK